MDKKHSGPQGGKCEFDFGLNSSCLNVKGEEEEEGV